MMRRAIRLLLGAALSVAPLAVQADALNKMHRIGWISLGAPEDAETSPFFEAFRGGLRELGYVEGKNILIEARWARGDPDRGNELAKELVGLGLAAIVTQGAAIRPVRPIAGSVPVVFGLSADPVQAGLVDSFARPGRNFTGTSFMSYEMNAKRIELLKEAFPAISRIALISNPEHPGEHIELETSRKAAATLGIALQYVPVRSVQDFEPAFAAVARERAEAMIALPDALLLQYRARLVEFAAQQGIPVVSGWSSFARSGGVMTYGPNLWESFRLLARSVDKILKGARPAEVPVEQPTTFELVVNLRAARALGIELPAAFIARADEVIE
jgi:putative ABC transport system substrate-binding protein